MKQDMHDALLLAAQSLRWFIKHYPNDIEITAHKIHLKKIEALINETLG